MYLFTEKVQETEISQDLQVEVTSKKSPEVVGPRMLGVP